MKIKFALLLSLVFFSCGRVENSSSQDKALYQPRTTGTQAHEDAVGIIAAKCATCHASWTALSDSDFVATGLVIPQNPTGSKIYFRNLLGPGPNNNMPQFGGPAMTAAELQTISEWITSVTP